MTAKFPITGEIAGDLIGMTSAELKLCKTTRDETVALFSDTRTNPNYVAAFMASAKEIAGTIFELKIPILPNTGGSDMCLEPVVRILKQCQLVIDLSTGEFLHLHRQYLKEVLSSGTRVLQVRAPDEQLRRCFPTDDLRNRTLKGAQRLDRSTNIRVTSNAGTNLRMSKEGRVASTQYGISDAPGRWDSWPSGFLYCAPV